MAYNLDEFGNVIGEYESEEERKRREELANTAVHTTETKTYGDGTVEQVTKREIPAGTRPAPQAPIAPQAVDQSAYTAQQESGGKKDIGYHFPADANGRRASSAFGMYGLTAPAYADIQKANPNFANRPIESLTPEEQTDAYKTFTGLNAQRLQKLGVEPTEANQRLAHLLGAGGAAKFIQTGEVSPQAAAANGGIENLKRIAGKRLQGQEAPASGAVNQPIVPQAQPGPGVAVATGQGVQGTMETPTAPVSPEQAAQVPVKTPNSFDEFGTPVYSEAQNKLQTHVDRFNAAQGNPEELMALGSDKNAPDWMRRRARDTVADLVIQERNQGQAQEQLQNLGPNDMAKVLSKKSEGNSVGDWLQYLLFKHVGLNDLANQKGEQLGIGHKWTTAYIQDENGKDVPVEIQTSASGKLIKGNLAGTDKVLTPEQLTQAAGAVQNADSLKTAQTQATHAYTQAYTSLMKQRDSLTQRGVGEQELAARGLDMASIQTRAQQAGKAVIDSARTQYRGQGAAAVSATGAPVTQGQTAQAVAQTPQLSAKPAGVLEGWTAFRPGETTANYDKRQQYTPEDIETEAKQLVAGDKTIKDITGRDAGLLRHYASARAKELDPNWSATDSDARRDSLKKWTNPDSNVAKQVRSHITASNSIQDVKQAFDALQNGNTPLFNEIRNTFRQNTGVDLPIAAKTGAMLLGPEIIKSIIPGGGGVTERLEAQHLMGVNLSPAQQKQVFKILEDFQGNSLKALETDWTRAKLPKDQFRERVLGGSPAAQELYDTASAHQAQQAARRAGLTAVPSQADIDAELKRRGLK